MAEKHKILKQKRGLICLSLHQGHDVCADEWMNGCQLPSTKELHDATVTDKKK